MKRAAVIAVQVAAAVLVGLAIRELWLAVTGEGDSTAAPRSAVAVTADVTPNVVAFGTPVVATADVVADARIVRPESIALQVDFTPYELAGAPRVERHVTGSSAHVRFRYPLRCLREGCEPAAARGVAEFPSGLVRYRFRDSPGSGRDIVEWPSVVVASRVAVPDVQEAREELTRMGVDFWVTTGVVGPQSQQIFMYDPFGNMIELHQAGTCRCVTGNRKPVGGMS